MKKILLALLIPSVAWAQSLTLSNVERSVWGSAEPGTIITSEAVVTNSSSSQMNVKVSSQDLTVLGGTVNYFCWGQCFEPGVFVSPNHITLQPGESVSDMFYGDYKPEGVSGTSTIKYCFYNGQSPSDSVCYIATFTAFPVGIDGAASRLKGMGDPYPNPAINFTNIKYGLGTAQAAKMEVFDMLGQKVRTITIDKADGAIKLDVTGLRPGVYLIRLENAGKPVATRRLNVVR